MSGDSAESEYDDKFKLEHLPRKRASFSPRFDGELTDYRAPAAPPPALPEVDPLEKIQEIKEARVGPLFVKYSMWAGGAAVAYTYLAGFRAMMQKDHPGWVNTFRQRLYIMTPVLAMYVAGSGLLPMPFRSQLEANFGRTAVTVGEWDKAERRVKEAKRAVQEAKEQQVADAFADKHIELNKAA